MWTIKRKLRRKLRLWGRTDAAVEKTALLLLLKRRGVGKEEYFQSNNCVNYFLSLSAQISSLSPAPPPAHILFPQPGSSSSQSWHIPVSSLCLWTVFPFCPNVWFNTLQWDFFHSDSFSLKELSWWIYKMVLILSKDKSETGHCNWRYYFVPSLSATLWVDKGIFL